MLIQWAKFGRVKAPACIPIMNEELFFVRVRARARIIKIARTVSKLRKSGTGTLTNFASGE